MKLCTAFFAAARPNTPLKTYEIDDIWLIIFGWRDEAKKGNFGLKSRLVLGLHSKKPVHLPDFAAHRAGRNVLISGVGQYNWLLANHALALYFAMNAHAIENKPTPPQQLHGENAEVFYRDAVGEQKFVAKRLGVSGLKHSFGRHAYAFGRG